MGHTSLRRKLAIASWSAPREGNIYGKLTVDAGPLLSYVEHLRETTGEKVTVTHVVGRAVAEALRRSPGVAGRILFGGYVPFPTVDISYLVALEEGADLGKALVREADRKSVTDHARELRERAARLRAGQDADFEKSKGLLRLLPSFLLAPVLWLAGFLTSALGIPAFGLERFPFGCCIVTSVGMFGLDEAFAPPTPFARVPVYVVVGAVRERAAVVDGRVVARHELTLCATVDHRFMDGHQGGTLARVVREALEAPWTLDGREAPHALRPLLRTGS